MIEAFFVLTIFRKILDRLIYNDKYPSIEEKMSDSNIGARKGKNIRNHLFIIYSVINSVINGGMAPIDIQIYDLEQAFDSLWLEDCLNDIYDVLSEESRDDKLALIYLTNVSNLVTVNTSAGVTPMMELSRIVQQGGVWGPMECSNTVDKIGRECSRRGIYSYKYKNTTRILPLAMVDDICSISLCGNDSICVNTFIETQINMKRLKFHTPDDKGKSKCHQLHIGGNKEYCPQLKVHGTNMEKVISDKYLGDILSYDGTNFLNINNRVSKGNGIVAQMMNILNTVAFGPNYFKIALMLRQSLLISSMLTNSEVWFGLSEKDIKQLESVDILYFRNLFRVPRTTPMVAYYLETGSLTFSTIIKIKRLKFLHYLANIPENEMLKKYSLNNGGIPLEMTGLRRQN